MTRDDLAAHALAIIDANLYLTLGTIDPDGHPWASPVYDHRTLVKTPNP